MRHLVYAATLSMLAVCLPLRGQEVFSFDFTQDQTGFFELGFAPEGTPHDSQLLFDPTLGSPAPGSLRLERTVPVFFFTLATTPCIAYDPKRQYTFRADAREQGTSMRCALTYTSYTTSDCTGQPFGAVDSPGTKQPGVWTPLEISPFFDPLLAIRSHRYHLVLDGPGTCNFDNVSLTVEQIDSIPALDGKRLAGLAVLLAIGGLIALRTR